MKQKPELPMPKPGTWWVRKCNGKRYYLRDAPKQPFGDRYFVWLYEEGKNRVLHLPLSTMLKCYTQYTEPHITSGPGIDPAHN